MGTIATRVELTDGISSVARNITRALNLMNNNLRAAQQASGQAMDTHGFNECDRLLKQINSELDAVEQTYEQINGQQSRFNTNLRSGLNHVDSLANKVKNIVGAYAGIQSLSALVETSDTMSSNTARLNLVGEQYGETDTDATLKNIYSAAQDSRGDYTDFIGSVSKLGLTAGGQFSDTEDITRFMELVNKNLVVGGASSTEQASATYQLTQAMASGRLQGDEYRSIIENAPLLAQAIEDYMIKVEGAQGTMKEWAADGLLAAEVIKNAVYNSADEVEARFEAMPYTWSQVMTSIKNEATAALSPVLKLVSGLAQNWQTVRTVLMLVTTAIVAYKVAQAAANIQTAVSQASALGMSGAKGVLIGTTAALTGSTVTETAAQWSLNTAMYACPAFWLFGGLAAVAGVALTVSANMGTAADSVDDMTKEIKDYTKEYRTAVDSISHKNQSSYIEAERAKALYNELDNLLNKTYLTVEETQTLKTAYEQLAEIIPSINDLDMSSGAVKLNEELRKAVDNFYDLAIANAYFNAYSQKLEEAILQKIDLEESLNTALDNIKSFEIDTTLGGNGNLGYHAIYYSMFDGSGYMGYITPEQYYSMFPNKVPEGYTMEQAIIDDNNNGLYYAYNWVEIPTEYDAAVAEYDSISAAIGKAESDIDTYLAGMSEYYEKSLAFDDEFGNSLDGIKDNTEKTVEELTYLRDLAEREAINRFTTAEVKIDMSGMNTRIDSEADFDGFIGLLSNGLAEALAVAAERAEVR